MILRQIKYLLKSHTGMHIDTVGDSTLDTAIRTRLRALSMTDKASYLALLQGSHAELAELTEEVVIPETWFFRDQHPFDTLVKYAKKALSKNGNIHWRILSVPSSTGEEPYSIAMSLLMAGMKPRQFSIEAVDISQRALERARYGHYGLHSFRGVQDIQVRERFFDKTENDYIIKPKIRNLVKFERANILDKNFYDRTAYDIIFCRNLLIYFDKEGKKAAYDILHHLLNQDGLLFIGHSECGAIPESFTHTRHTSAFAYQKISANPGKPEAGENDLLAIVNNHATAADLPQADIPEAPTPEAETRAEPKQEANNESHIDLARRYADAGNLVDAEHICQICLHENPQDASAHCLLGLIHGASNHPEEAENSYRKALYLDPHHTDALIQLALLLEAQGKRQQAKQLRQRASSRQEQSA